ncbi:MAG TPA: hypothetical protein VFM23_07450 [Gemmatimonadales bacterium]|nr:hypothetical protein [Gemmatimonadales bacterium]
MILALIGTVAMLQIPARAAEPVRVWRTDSTAHVSLRQSGHLLVLHVDAIGRIQVLYPLTPDDTFAVSSGSALEIALPPTAQGNPATFLAIRSRWAFDYSAVRWGSWWDYQNALLLQPTAGDPLAALLEIADRVSDGRPYDFAEATYGRGGALIARGPVEQPDVCWTCTRPRPAPPAAVAAATTSVDCTNATLTNSFCGVASAPVTISAPAAPASPAPAAYPPAPAPAYVPYYLPVFVHHARPRVVEPPPPSRPAPRSMGVAYPIVPRRIVPSSSALPR